MAEEKVITSPEASPIAASAADGHKRKLEDMELNNAPQPLTDSEPKLDPDSLNNGDQDEENGGADESDTKRPRLDSNGDNVSEPDGLVPQNGHQEGGKEDEPKEEDSKQPEPAADSAQPAEGQEPREEPSEKINEEPASDENEKTQIGTTDDLEPPKAEVEAPSEELAREGDVPVPSDEGQPGSDTQILSRKMEVPNDKVGVLIGKAGDTIRSLQDNSGAKIQIMRDADADPRSATRPLEIVGTLENINKAEKLIKDVIAEGNYNYGQQQGPDYGHPPYSQTPAQPFGHGYNEAKYDHHASSQHFGHMGSQPTPYAQGGTHSGYGPQDQYGKPPMYGMQPQVPHSQPYGQPRPNQPGEVPYQGPGSSAQSYGQNMPPQQSYPYASSGPMQQSYPLYGSAPTTDGYGHTPATASASGYPPQGGQPVAGYAQPGYAEQPAANNATYGYQGPADPAYGAAQGPAAYPATAAGQTGYAQPSQTQPGYDQSGGYGNVPAPAGYGKSVSPQAAYAQYDSSQMYGAHR
ncbi:UNVERIFIED_CONTAM: Far upstream element-binding protein 3 [Sesamum calycinum]|uniref:Far upstream element-binding protein 3 n=1 Tax=Sesamum calycinum TaxID=2727403 RepID=A0AAW2P5N9_9LAMI